MKAPTTTSSAFGAGAASMASIAAPSGLAGAVCAHAAPPAITRSASAIRKARRRLVIGRIVARRAAAGFLLHLGDIDRAIELRPATQMLPAPASGSTPSLEKGRVEFVRGAAFQRDVLLPESQGAVMLGDVDIARMTGDLVGRDRDCPSFRKVERRVAVEKLCKRGLVLISDQGRVAAGERGQSERTQPKAWPPSPSPAEAAQGASKAPRRRSVVSGSMGCLL